MSVNPKHLPRQENMQSIIPKYMATKEIKDFVLSGKRMLPSGCAMMSFTTADGSSLPQIYPGQFVEVEASTKEPMSYCTLRRPISVCDVHYGSELILFIKPLGKGTRELVDLPVGAVVNIILPLGHGFTTDVKDGENVLLTGGGVGCAPLVMLCKELKSRGARVTVAIGGRSANDVKGIDGLYESADCVAVATDDGSYGHKGIVTSLPVYNENFDRIYCCGPTPMMRTVGKMAAELGAWCELSLENHMACGLGACLCCVEKTDDSGNVCVCTEGPVFNINRLKSWLQN